MNDAHTLMRQGVSPSQLYLPKYDQAPATIYEYLCQRFGHIDASTWRQRFDDGLVMDASGATLSVDSRYQHGLTIHYYRHLPAETVVPFDHRIIYENDHFLVVDKPHFLTVAPAGRYVLQTLLTRLKCQSNNAQLSPIHRLDRETAGLIMFAKTPSARAIYQALFAERKVDKVYHAIAPFRNNLQFPLSLNLHLTRGEPFYTMKVVDAQANTHTDIDVIKISDDGQLARYELRPSTGKLHQLRVHLNHLGIAIMNDSFYPKVAHKSDDDFSNPLQLLAKHLSFIDPLTGEQMVFESGFELDLPSGEDLAGA